MNNKQPKQLLIYFLAALLIISIAVLSHTFIRINSLTKRLDSTDNALAQQKQDSEKQYQLALNEIDYQKSILRPIVDLENNQIVLPEVGLRLPYNDITKTFQYSYDSGEYGYLRITSSLISDHAERQLSCSELALINFKNAEAINPWTETAGSVQLDDGRTFYIVSPIAFENNEASTVACASEVWLQITPQQVANEFKQAKSQ